MPSTERVLFGFAPERQSFCRQHLHPNPMSREMKSSEVNEFEKKFGYKPTAVKVAVDALAVFVDKDNPIKGLTLAPAGRYLFQHAEAQSRKLLL
jgi:hypothetical protein